MGGSKKADVGTWYYVATQFLLGYPADAMLGWHVGDKTAWSGRITDNTGVQVHQANLLGGEKDQGGVEGTLRFEFGGDDQLPNAHMTSAFGAQTVAWRGFTTAAWEGGKYGANNPYPQPSSFTGEWIKAMWDGGCWYPERAAILDVPAVVERHWTHLRMVVDGQMVYGFINGKRVIVGELDFVPNGGMGGYTTVGRYRHSNPGESYSGFIDNVVVTRAALSTNDFSPPRFVPNSGDPFWPEVVICLRGDGTDGSSAFTDDKGNAWTVVSPGITNSTEEAITGGGSIKVAGGGAISTPYSDNLNIGSHFTIDAWVRPDELAGYVICVNQKDVAHAGYWMRLHPDGGLDVVVGRNTWPSPPAAFTSGQPMDTTLRSCNPAHILYYLQTQPGRGAEPVEHMDDVNLRAAADWYYAQGFGLCCTRKAANESPADFIRKIEQVAGCSFVRNPVTGKFRVNIANGEYDRDSLPVLTDDDVLSFKETPTVLADAINSVSVRYRDPVKRQTITTAPVRALALIAAFGERHQTLDYPEIPTAPLASRVALRELLGFITPTRKFELDTKSTTDSFERGQYFLLQLAKRNIDMVCEVGEIIYGNLRSGGNQLVAVQDTVRVPDGSYTETEPGVDTRPPQVALPINVQAAFEAPYFEVCRRLSRTELAALPDDAGYLIAAAADPGNSRDFTLSTDAGSGYEEVGYGDFCPVATIAESADPITEGPFTLTSGQALAGVQIGDPGLWGAEICRVKAIDIGALTIMLGRGCGDTVGQTHAAVERIFFYSSADFAYDDTEYTDGEMVHAKLLTNTSSQQVDPALAGALDVEFGGRQARPYPPAAPTLNGESWPSEIFEIADVAWRHRDRVAQADQLFDQEVASIGPEPGTTYTVRWFLNDVLVNTAAGVAGTSTSFAPTADGALRVEIETQRDGLTSWQMQVIECIYRTSHYSTYIDQGGDTYVDQDGNHYIG